MKTPAALKAPAALLRCCRGKVWRAGPTEVGGLVSKPSGLQCRTAGE